MTEQELTELILSQQNFFSSGATFDLDFRLYKLKSLKKAIISFQEQIITALNNDLGKSEFEAYSTEVGLVLSELSFTIKKLRSWAKPQSVSSPLFCFPAKSKIFPQPYGKVLIMSPWNYPFYLALMPLISAVAAGNCVMLKPSSTSSATSAIIEKIIAQVFLPEYVCVLNQGSWIHQCLLEQHFDYIFFTGSVAVGKKVMEAASKHLTPVCLELGGKSPCIVDKTVDVEFVARRIIWGKLLNSGQTCVAPDYILVDSTIKDKLVTELCKQIVKLYGNNPTAQNSTLPSIINQKHFLRLKALCDGSNISNGKVIVANSNKYPLFNEETRKIAPVVLDSPTQDSPVMKEEIFGPILPVIPMESMEEAISFVASKPEPLALYVFTKDKRLQQKVVKMLRYGGGCINDVVLHLSSHRLPFGGIGNSGMGCYHGKAGFYTFVHLKSILKSSDLLDLPFRYPPYKNHLKYAKALLK
ncbi:MAG: aldehyde dehydrogenase [Spirochaetaceae bacterium]|nr:aldehyde dehydrogenase [Spirochaetaceae bacterium]